jgi:UDP-N-acetylmuramyl pentapeptide phosphotransferase/UDP-N-acetylglucosamine-1-phosphate transferase
LFDAALFVGALILAWALTLGIERRAVRLRLLDVPNPRSMHKKVTPRGGGAAIVAVTLIGVAVAAAFGVRPEWPALGGYLGGVLVIVAVSLADDFLTLPSGLRLAAQVISAAIMVAGLELGSQGIVGGQSGLAWLILPAAIVWTVGLTNAYNFMDGIDGIAATQGLVAGLGWCVLGSISHQTWLAVLGLSAAAGCAGFLVRNWPPAKIFMGDVGSAFLGFTFGFMTLAALRQTPQLAVAGALLLWPFVFDTSFTIIRRMMRGENLLIAHRSHIYQRLVLAGWHQYSVTLLYGLLSLVALALGALWLWSIASARS